MELLERIIRRISRKTVMDGRVAFLTHDDPDLVEAFTTLGWTDPHQDPEPLPEPPPIEVPTP